MKRPTKVPSKPYTVKQVLDMVYQHFVVDKMPKSVKNPDDRTGGLCCYAGSGCAIGCMLPASTALSWDKCGKTAIDDIRKILPKSFFQFFNGEHGDMLAELQDTHDGNNDPDTLAEEMSLTISRLRKEYQ